MKHIFIINPTAGKYDSRQRIYEMAEHLRSAHGLDVQCILTKKQGHATEIARRLCEEGGERFHPIEGVERDAAAAFPIIGAGDVSGAVVLLTADEAAVPTQTEIKLVQVAASFLGKQMEE